MKSRTLMYITAITLFTALAIPFRIAAQEQKGQQENKEQQAAKPHRYVLNDLGTFGGPSSTVKGGKATKV